MNDIPAPPSDRLPDGRGSGRLDFESAIRAGLAAAAREGWNRILLCDPDFADWPLGERSSVAALEAWVNRGRMLQILARDYTVLRRLHPRFVQWRTVWSHRVEAHACPQVNEGEMPSAFWTPSWTLERLDRVHGSFVASHTPQRRAVLSERIQACWLRSAPSLPATTLGL
jgi:hypothetical protein